MSGWSFRAAAIVTGVLFGLVSAEVMLRTYRAAMRQDPIEALMRTKTAQPPHFSGTCDWPAPQATLGDIIEFTSRSNLVYELKPNVDTCYFGARVRTSAQRLRGTRVYSLPKDPNTFRILVLGDSITFGQGVGDDEPFTERMREVLAALRGKPVEVINTGLDGYNTVQEAALLEQRGLALKPDCVIVVFCGNDLDPPTFLQRPATGLELDRLYVGEIVKRALHPNTDPFENRFGLVKAKDVIPEYRHLAGMEAYLGALKTMDRLTDAAGIPLVLFAEYNRSLDWREVEAFIESAGIVRPKFRFPVDLKYRLGLDNGHLNPTGHREMARRMLKGLFTCGERCTGVPSSAAPSADSTEGDAPQLDPDALVPPGKFALQREVYGGGQFANFSVEGKAGSFTITVRTRGTRCKDTDGTEYPSLTVTLDHQPLERWRLSSDAFRSLVSKPFQLSGKPQEIALGMEDDLFVSDACDRNLSVDWVEFREAPSP